VIDVDAARSRIGMSGRGAARVREIAARRLSDAVNVDVLGDRGRRG
jgi:hypothetical protein